MAIETDPSLPSGRDLIPLDDILGCVMMRMFASNSAHNVQSSADSDSLIPGYLLVSSVLSFDVRYPTKICNLCSRYSF